MNSIHEHCAQELKRMNALVDSELERFFAETAQGPAERMYNMLRYFMGFLDADFKSSHPVGKRFRSSLCLLIAEAYGARDASVEAAVAIELFHNFSLIHDDIEDHDEMRRGRPTVWKLWGINHAINSGDVQSLLASQWCMRAARHPKFGPKLADILLEAFIEVGEGQYFDFELADASPFEIDEAQYMRMIEKKSGALVRVSAEVAGVASQQSEGECALLREYGLSLGMAYQIADDFNSVWSAFDQTGKDAQGDIRERKRTLPFIYARTKVDGRASARLDELYTLPRQLTDTEVQETFSIIDTPDVRNYIQGRAIDFTKRAKLSAGKLSLPQKNREILSDFVDSLVRI